MTNELSKIQKCLLTRDGVEVWIDEDKAEKLEQDLIDDRINRFFRIEGRLINIADITGIFNPKDLDELRRRQRGMWKCKRNQWHNKTERCECGRVG